MNTTRSNGIVFAAGPVTEQGGSSEYAREIARELKDRSYRVSTVHFNTFSSPVKGLRHAAFVAQLIRPALRSRAIIAIDTWSVGIPAFVAAKLTGCRLIIRVGGDFLWEHYVRRTGNEVKLSQFYKSQEVRLTFKERLIFAGTRYLLQHTDCIAFNTEWQMELWKEVYGLRGNARVIENRYPPHVGGSGQRTKVFVSAGRASALKNMERVEAAFAQTHARHPEFSLDVRILSEKEHEERLHSCYALIQGSFSDVAPNAVIKAAAYGTPFICTEDTGIQNRLEGKGLFIDTLDQDALVRAIESLRDPETYTRLSAASTAPGFERDWDRVADDFESALRHVGVER